MSEAPYLQRPWQRSWEKKQATKKQQDLIEALCAELGYQDTWQPKTAAEASDMIGVLLHRRKH